MEFLQALAIGITQGITEFFPISSSFHLKMIRLLLGVEEQGVLFDLMCHFGTSCALLYYLRRDLFEILTRKRTELLSLGIALLPLPILYFLIHSSVERFGNALNALFLLVTALILFLGQRFSLPRKLRLYQDPFFVGIAQGCALLPGLSRSALTISTARFLGWEVRKAVRFSFLLSIPTILGGNVLKLLQTAGTGSISVPMCATGFFSSCITGLATIRFALHYLEKGRYTHIIWYCTLVGAAYLIYSFV